MTPDKRSEKSNNKEEPMERLINKAAELDQKHSIEVSNTESAYQRVVEKAGISTQSRSGTRYFKYAAAAALLIGLIGLGYLLTPNQVSVPNGETSTVTLSDGTTITLNSGSNLTYPRWFNIWGRTVTLHGEAFFDVTQNGSEFRVEAGQAQVTVMGTQFNVRSYNNEQTSVYLKEGRIAFSGKDKTGRVILQPGEFSWISPSQPQPTAPETSKEEEAIAWMKEGLAFENQPLSVIFNEITRRFDVQIKANNDSLLQQKLTIYLSRIANAEQAIDDICRVKGLEYSRNGNNFTISKSI